MSTELSRLYRSLAADTEDAMLPTPESVRRRADRRARVRAGLLTATVAVLVAGTAVGSQIVFAGHDGAPAPAGTPTVRPATPTPSPSVAATPSPAAPTAASPTGSPGRPVPQTIPDRAFFELPASTDAGYPPKFTKSTSMVPRLCGATYPSERSVVARRTRHLVYKLPSTPAGDVPDGSFDHTITIYRAGAASDWMAEFREAVQACPSQRLEGGLVHIHKQRLLAGTRFGDESLLLEVSIFPTNVNGEPDGDGEIRLVQVVRIGDVVTVLYEQGWEGTSSDGALVDDFTRRAVTKIQAWLR